MTFCLTRAGFKAYEEAGASKLPRTVIMKLFATEAAKGAVCLSTLRRRHGVSRATQAASARTVIGLRHWALVETTRAMAYQSCVLQLQLQEAVCFSQACEDHCVNAVQLCALGDLLGADGGR